VAMHWRRQLVYFSTSRDRVLRIALNETRHRRRSAAATFGSAGRRRTRTPSAAVNQAAAEVVYQAGSRTGAGAGLKLSVDWLYDRLYVADENTVTPASSSHLPVAIATAPPAYLPDIRVHVRSHLLQTVA